MKKNFMLACALVILMVTASPMVALDIVDHPTAASLNVCQVPAIDAAAQRMPNEVALFAGTSERIGSIVNIGARVGTADSRQMMTETVASNDQKAGDFYHTGSTRADYSNQDADARQEVFSLRVQMRSALPGENLLNEYRSAA